MQIGSVGAGASSEFQVKLANGANDQQEEVVSTLIESTEQSSADRSNFDTGQKLNVSA